MKRLYLTAKNLDKFQQYKDDRPIHWIKLWVSILDDYEFGLLKDKEKYHLISIWLLLSRLRKPIPADKSWIKSKIQSTEDIDLQRLIDSGFVFLVDGNGKSVRNRTDSYESLRPLKENINNIKNIKKINTKKEKEKITPEFLSICKKIIDHLNIKCGTNFDYMTRKTQFLIKKRIDDGFVFEDFIKTIDNMCEQWQSDKKMCQYLKPQTLFSEKMENYRNKVTFIEKKPEKKSTSYQKNRDVVKEFLDKKLKEDQKNGNGDKTGQCGLREGDSSLDIVRGSDG